jgi:ATP-dependent Clp protease ATP-binding subunit ClpA
MAKPPIGFERGTRRGDDQDAINRLFSPEFRNRLDATIGFAHLTPEIVERVVDKFIMQLEEQLADRMVSIELTPEARRWLAQKGYDPAFGARPLSRVIQEHVKRGIADELLFGKLASGGVVKVRLEGESLAFDYLPDADRPRRKPKPPAKEPELAR